ncbi:MAG TPA: hypothetical protein P5248_10045, partial [Bacteroidales bacterium]|nr:hypothetical protein [Bacteroidales bacterium]
MALPHTNTTYTLIVARANSAGCDATDDVTVTVNAAGPLAIDAGPATVRCINGPAIVIGPAAQAGLVYRWTPSVGLSDSSVAQPLAQPLNTITYHLLVVDTVNCLAGEDSVSVIVQQEPGNIAGPPASVCYGDSVQIGQLPIPGASYTWSPATRLSSNTIADPLAGPLSTTTYAVTMTINGCSFSDEVQVRVNPLPSANAGPDKTNCYGSMTIGTTNSPFESYSWSPANGLSDPTSGMPIANPSVATTYTLTVQTLATGCTNTDQVLVNPFPVAYAGTDKTICPGDQVSIGLPGVPGFTYTWSPATGLDNNHSAQAVASPLSTTTYTLVVSNGSCTRNDNVVITVKSPGSLSINDPGLLCNGTCRKVSAQFSGGTFLDLQWSPPNLFDDPFSANPELCVSQPTTIYLTAQHASTACYVTDSINLTVNPALAPQADAGSDTTICQGDTLTLGAPGPLGLLYEWNPTAVYIPDRFAAMPQVVPLSSTTFMLTVTDLATLCYSTDEVRVNLSTISVYAGYDEYMCKGEIYTLGGIMVSGSSDYSVLWSPAAGVSDPTVLEPEFSPDTTTRYTLLVTDNLAGCQAMDQVMLSIVPGQPPVFELGKDIFICRGGADSIQIGIPPKPGLSYEW